MLATFAQITPHLKFKAKTIVIDNLGFKFHYRGTFLILMVCTVLVTSRQVFDFEYFYFVVTVQVNSFRRYLVNWNTKIGS